MQMQLQLQHLPKTPPAIYAPHLKFGDTKSSRLTVPKWHIRLRCCRLLLLLLLLLACHRVGQFI